MKILLGNIFDSQCNTLVNTVNCVGVRACNGERAPKERTAKRFGNA